MRYALDTEFIDTPSCSALISLALVAEDGRSIYREFDYPKEQISVWLEENVIPLLSRRWVTFQQAAVQITHFIGADKHPEIWAYYGAYDWYWFCRLFGGMMNVPQNIDNHYHEFLDIQQGIPNTHGAEHHALNDALSLMDEMKRVRR